MPAVAVLLGILLGSATPVAIGAVTALQWAELGLNVAPSAVKVAVALAKQGKPPPPGALPDLEASLRANAIANGEYVIRTYPGNDHF